MITMTKLHLTVYSLRNGVNINNITDNVNIPKTPLISTSVGIYKIIEVG